MKKPIIFLLFFVVVIAAYPQSGNDTIERPEQYYNSLTAEQKKQVREKSLGEFLDVSMFLDVIATRRFNYVDDNNMVGKFGNRNLRQAIDFFKEKTKTGVCVYSRIDKNHFWVKFMSGRGYITQIVRKGINAVKNAYDRRFQQKLIERAPNMLLCRYYYKGYSCISIYSYYFKNRTTNRVTNLRRNVFYLHSGKYNNVYLKRWNNTRTVLFDILLGHELSSVLDNNVITYNIPHNLLYIQDAGSSTYTQINSLNLSFDTKDLFDCSSTVYDSYENIVQSNQFPYIERLKNSEEVMSIDFGKYGEIISLKENDQTIPVSHTTLYALIKENITGPDKIYLQNGIDALVTALTDESVWGNFIWKNTYPTWCNVYAQYLSSYIYGQIDGDYRVSIKDGTMSANKLNDHFNNGKSSIHYKELPKSDEIWTKYINKGYPVYFLVLGDLKTNGFRCPGHIETGFPASTGINIWNGKIFGQENSLASILNVTSNKLVVGAGGTVGFKSYDEYKWLKSDQTRASLSFQYLNNVYDKKQ